MKYLFNLKHCPFCGGCADVKKNYYGNYTVECRGCGAKSEAFKSKRMAKRAWNLRVKSK